MISNPYERSETTPGYYNLFLRKNKDDKFNILDWDEYICQGIPILKLKNSRKQGNPAWSINPAYLDLPDFYISAIEKWHIIREWHRVDADDLVFCADMYLCFDKPEYIFDWLDDGILHSRVVHQLRRGYDKFVMRFGYCWRDYK